MVDDIVDQYALKIYIYIFDKVVLRDNLLLLTIFISSFSFDPATVTR